MDQELNQAILTLIKQDIQKDQTITKIQFKREGNITNIYGHKATQYIILTTNFETYPIATIQFGPTIKIWSMIPAETIGGPDNHHYEDPQLIPKLIKTITHYHTSIHLFMARTRKPTNKENNYTKAPHAENPKKQKTGSPAKKNN